MTRVLSFQEGANAASTFEVSTPFVLGTDKSINVVIN
jgi:hypothetical protein